MSEDIGLMGLLGDWVLRVFAIEWSRRQGCPRGVTSQFQQ